MMGNTCGNQGANYKMKNAKTMTRILIIGTKFSLLQREKVKQFLFEHAERARGGYVCVSNVHTTVMAKFDSFYRAIQNDSLLTVPDGVPLVWAMNMLRHSQVTESQDRVRGPTLMREMISEGRARSVKHYLFGSRPETLQALRETLVRQYPGVQIVGAESPPFRPLTAEEQQSVARRINESGAHFVWVGLGAPKQERWMFENSRKINAVLLGVGAAFDLIPGRIPEAPRWMQSMGLEWLYRLCKEPRRLWKRYLFTNPVFVASFSLQLLRNRLFSQSYLCESVPSD